MIKFRIVGALLSFWAVAAQAGTPTIIPLPQQLQVLSGQFTLCPSQANPAVPAHVTTQILVDGASQSNGQYLAAQFLKSTACQFPVVLYTGGSAVKGAILLTTVNAKTNLGAEGYELTVAPDSVVIRAPAAAGVFYGVQSLLQLLPPQILAQQPAGNVAWTAPCVYIQDQPRFPWRGWMLDVVRHFFNKQEIKQLLDVMALHKLNTFHWHLVDDQGWRIQIMAYPLLTQVGSWRGGIDWGLNPLASTAWNSSGQYGGYYTQADVREIVAYAQERHITIVPEIEMPGHSTAGVGSYPQYSCNPNYAYNMDSINTTYNVYSPGTAGTFQFLENILTEVMGLFPGQYIHCGGDEVSSTIWTTYAPDVTQMQALGINPGSSTAVQQYQHWFTSQIANFLQSKGRTLFGWTEIEYGGILTNAAVMDWLTGSSSEAVSAASAKQNVVMSPTSSCYFDYYQNTGVTYSEEPPAIGGNLPLSTVYAFEPIPSGLSAQYDSYILGAQGNQWCEYVPSLQNVEFKSYPRLCAIAELTWTPAALKNYTSFTQRLVTHEQRLTQLGVNYDNSSSRQIGNWTPSQISAGGGTLSWNITADVSAVGEVDVSFLYTSGADALDISWTALQVNGVEISRDTHAGVAGSSPSDPVYVLHLPALQPGATYTIQAWVAGAGGTTSSGKVYLPSWN